MITAGEYYLWKEKCPRFEYPRIWKGWERIGMNQLEYKARPLWAYITKALSGQWP